MRADFATEDVWHFVGMLALAVEQARARADFDAFERETPAPAHGPLRATGTVVDAPLAPLPFEPAVSFRFEETPLTPVFSVRLRPLEGETTAPFASHSWTADALPPHLAGGFRPPWPDLRPEAREMSPSDPLGWPAPSLAVVVRQENRLDDDDYAIEVDLGAAFAPTALFNALREDAARTADALGPLPAIAPPADAAAAKAAALDLLDALTAAADGPEKAGPTMPAETAPDPSTEAPAGPAVSAATLRGEAAEGRFVDGAPSPTDDGVAEAVAEALREAAAPARPEQAPGPEPSAPLVAAGGNMLVNSAVLADDWLDATAVVVAGDNITIDAISQVNVATIGRLGAPALAAEPSIGNLATLSRAESAPLSSFPAALPDPLPDAPRDFSLSVVDGDLLNVVWLEQTNFLSDNDIASVALSGESSMFVLGENQLVNAAEIVGLGFRFDVVVVDGDRVDVAVIEQTNVLLDLDTVSVAAPAAHAPGPAAATVWNIAEISRAAAVPAEAAVGALSELGERLAAAARTVDAKAAALESLAGLPELGGADRLDVLHVRGDLIEMHYVRQTNVLGDADQIAAELARKLAEIGVGTAARLETGDNALVNLASIAKAAGPDSLFVGGEAYSDALIHQAGLIELDPAADADDGPSALINEAVAFLAEGLFGDDDNSQTAAIRGDGPEDHHLDALQSMTA